jgi:predicted DNA binding CopG/RHH family protein
MAKRTLKPIPRFRTEAEERRFWETHDTTDYVDWSRAAEASFPELKPTTTTISLRIPSGLLSELKILANKQDVPYQSLLKVLLAESVARERRSGAGKAASRLHQSKNRRRRRA